MSNAVEVLKELRQVRDTYHDLQVGYRFSEFNDLGLTFGVNNVFEEDPPICLSCSLNGYDASTYDIPGGRFFYLRADMKF